MRWVASETGWLQQVLLLCGLLAPLLYVGTDRLAGLLLRDYNFTSQSMSELSASGSPVRALVVALTCIATVLMLAFGVGVWRAEGPRLLPRVVALLVMGNAALGLVASVFFPTRFGERPVFASPGVLLMFLSVLCFVLAMVVGAVAFRGWLRILSIGIPASYVLLTILRFATAASSAAGATASLVGSQERTMAFSFLLWVMALAVYLWLATRGAASATASGV